MSPPHHEDANLLTLRLDRRVQSKAIRPPEIPYRPLSVVLLCILPAITALTEYDRSFGLSNIG